MPCTATVLLLASLLWGRALPQDTESPRRLRIVAEIDGVDDLHLSATEARWIHRAYSTPDFVSINGRTWNPSLQERLSAGDEPFLAPSVDLAGATATLVRGRGKLDFRHAADGLLLSFDDSLGGGADEYEVLVEFADVLCEEPMVLGDPGADHVTELAIQARIDGRDELYLGPWRADWLHQAWSWPAAVEVGGRAWDPRAAALVALPKKPFFSPYIDLEQVRMELENGRGKVGLEVVGERLLLSFDDEADSGAGDYVVRLSFPEPPENRRPRLPTGPALRVRLAHRPASDVAGAKLTVMALSPATGAYIPWPGLRGMDASGRCVVALPSGTYRFEVLHRPSPDRLVALRTAPIRVTDAVNIDLPAAEPCAPVWRAHENRLELRELAVHSVLGRGEVSWTKASSGADLELVASPGEDFSLRAFGAGDDLYVAWWQSLRFGERASLNSTGEVWIQSDFAGHGEAGLPAGCAGTFHSPTSAFSFPIGGRTRFLTNRRFTGFSYRHTLDGGGSAIYHPRQLLLPEAGGAATLALGGAPVPRGSAAILQNENLGSPEARELWWELVLVDPGGYVLDTKASDIEWSATAGMKDGSPLPEAPLDLDALRRLAEPVETVSLAATYRWNGEQRVTVGPAPAVLLQNEHYRSVVPGHLDHRALAYLDKARRTYRAIEAARGKPGEHTEPIELRWWLNGGAVGIRGSITMPIGGMTEDFDWFSFPWALAHESLHGFGYDHGPELDRLDRAAIELFERETWRVESDPSFVPEDW